MTTPGGLRRARMDRELGIGPPKRTGPGPLADVIARVMKLAEYVKVGAAGMGVLRDFTGGRFEVSIAARDGAEIEVSRTGGFAIVRSWMESGHNGDPYDSREESLTDAELSKMLGGVEATLMADAKRRLERERAEAARKAYEKGLERDVRKLLGIR